MRYIVILEEKTIHRVELEADNADEANNQAREQWMAGYLCDDDPYLDELRVLEVRTEEEDGA